MENQNRGPSSLIFILVVLVAMLIATTFAPGDQANGTQKALFRLGLAVFIIGTVWRAVQKLKKAQQVRSIIVQTVGSVVAALAYLSILVW